MNDQIKKKEIPAGAAKFTPPIYEDTEEGDIDGILKKELDEQGLEYRFIDFKKAKDNGGRNRAGWIVYKRQSVDPRLAGIEALADPDGLVRQGSMVLAVKTKSGADKLRSRREDQNRYMRRYTENVTKELGAHAQTNLRGSRLLAGYDKNS